MSEKRYNILCTIHTAGLNRNQIAEKLDICYNAVVKAVASMLREKLVEGKKGKGESTCYVLTELGKLMWQKIEENKNLLTSAPNVERYEKINSAFGDLVDPARKAGLLTKVNRTYSDYKFGLPRFYDLYTKPDEGSYGRCSRCRKQIVFPPLQTLDVFTCPHCQFVYTAAPQPEQTYVNIIRKVCVSLGYTVIVEKRLAGYTFDLVLMRKNEVSMVCEISTMQNLVKAAQRVIDAVQRLHLKGGIIVVRGITRKSSKDIERILGRYEKLTKQLKPSIYLLVPTGPDDLAKQVRKLLGH